MTPKESEPLCKTFISNNVYIFEIFIYRRFKQITEDFSVNRNLEESS